jgi:hypothetical protein
MGLHGLRERGRLRTQRIDTINKDMEKMAANGPCRGPTRDTRIGPVKFDADDIRACYRIATAIKGVKMLTRDE